MGRRRWTMDERSSCIAVVVMDAILIILAGCRFRCTVQFSAGVNGLGPVRSSTSSFLLCGLPSVRACALFIVYRMSSKLYSTHLFFFAGDRRQWQLWIHEV